MPEIKLKIRDLVLDPDNPRITHADGQVEALQKIVKDQKTKLVKLAQSIIDHGLNPMDRFLVVRVGGKPPTFIALEGNRRVAVLRNEYTHEEEERLVDQIVVELGTLPNDGLYFDLKDHSLNRGETDLDSLIAGRPQEIASNPQGRFQLFRIGDAVACRSIHAAIYDAIRLCKEF